MSVSNQELQDFLEHDIPRQIPKRIRRAAIKHTTINVLIGIGILLILCSIPLIYFISPLQLQQDLHLDIATRAVAKGKILSIAPTKLSKNSRGQTHRVLCYTFAFSVKGKKVIGQCFALENKNSLRIGDVVDIEYIKATPAINRIGGLKAAPFGYSSLLIAIIPVIGLSLLLLGLFHKAKIVRLLSCGIATCGLITSVKATGASVNNKGRYLVTISFSHKNQHHLARITVYGIDAFMAQQKMSNRQRANLLFDSKRPNNVILIEKVLL